MKVVSFFAGCGGLDLGFEQAGFQVVWANELEPSVRETYIKNHPATIFHLGDICSVNPEEIPDCDGFIGGPPCQSWSVAGCQRGLDDKRGQMFLTYIDIINKKKPKFFLIENVNGLLTDKFKDTFDDFVARLQLAGYDVEWKLLDAVDYGVPQNRERVFIIGFRKDLKIKYKFPEPTHLEPIPLCKAIGDILEQPRQFLNERICSENSERANHDVYVGDFGPYYKRGNRRRLWERASFTIHATGESAPLHPSSPKMVFHGHENWDFQNERIGEYRRLSVRECARIQTFPDRFIFYGQNIKTLYRMIGNAVPPRLSRVLAQSINSVLLRNDSNEGFAQPAVKPDRSNELVLVAYYKSENHLKLIERNRLYYVRSDGRQGSIFKSETQVMPRLLLLHHRDNYILYDLKKEEPILTDNVYLQSLGFETSGSSYLCFILDNAERIRLKDLGADALKNPSTLYPYKPFFIKLKDLINKVK